MDLKHKVAPFVLSGTLAFGGMIVPAKATAIDEAKKDEVPSTKGVL
jgi:hypothetical protein